MAATPYQPAVQRRDTPDGVCIYMYKNVRVPGPRGVTTVSLRWDAYPEFMRRHGLTPDSYPSRLRMAAKELLDSAALIPGKPFSKQVLAHVAQSK